MLLTTILTDADVPILYTIVVSLYVVIFVIHFYNFIKQNQPLLFLLLPVLKFAQRSSHMYHNDRFGENTTSEQHCPFLATTPYAMVLCPHKTGDRYTAGHLDILMFYMFDSINEMWYCV